MKIVADENIPHVSEAFADLGDVTTCAGRSINADLVRNADVLLVRSVTKVGEALLSGSSVSYVGTATAGLEHIDQSWLADNGIGFGHAKGANANSVAEYVIAAMLEAGTTRNLDLRKLTCGIVGFGHVGSNVYTKCQGLGLDCRVYDPPLAENLSDNFFCDWDDILSCDIVTCHTPLTTQGTCPTYHMIDDSFFSRVTLDTILINAARGGVVDSAALMRSRRSNPGRFVALDVWENEPNINSDLVDVVDIATAHIAGYSWDAKIAGTRHVFEGVCRHFNSPCDWAPPSSASASPPRSIRIEVNPSDSSGVLRDIVQQAYEITEDDRLLREAITGRGETFDMLRKNYRTRREFAAFEIDRSTLDTQTAADCDALGFTFLKTGQLSKK